MTIKALFLDFYGTIVHEDDDIIPLICSQIQVSSKITCSSSDVGSYWWKTFSTMFRNSYGYAFETQRVLAVKSLAETISYFESDCRADEIIQLQFEHWKKPGIFEDSKPYLEGVILPVYILSNIDTEDVQEAVRFHKIKVDGIITSEDVRSYKPRPELFIEAMKRYGLNKNEVIHVGDSLSSDIQGAQGVGIQAVWINRKNKKLPDHIKPDHTVENLIAINTILKI